MHGTGQKGENVGGRKQTEEKKEAFRQMAKWTRTARRAERINSHIEEAFMGERERERERERDRQTDRDRDIHTDRQRQSRKERRADKQKCRDGEPDRQTEAGIQTDRKTG